MPTTEVGNFVNVIATIDRVNHIGKILYVNPTTISVVAAAAPPPAPDEGYPPDPFDGYALSLQDADGRELEHVPAAVHLSCCDAKMPETALIQQDLVFN